MATTAPLSTSWIPEDDLLLKNAIEAGASLEALAKGAIKFSRRFTYKELWDRWHSLLYDHDVSARASALMFELELSGFSPSTKSIKSENYKGHFTEKRKRGSIRKHYYAMRKKFHSEFFCSTDLEFLDEPTLHQCHGHGSNPREPHGGSFISDNLGLQEADLDILRNVFPVTERDHSSTSAFDGANDGYPVEHTNPIGDDYPSGILRNEFPPDVSTSSRQDERGSELPNIKGFDISQSIRNNAPNFGKSAAMKESGLVQVPPGKRLFRGAGKKQLSTFDTGQDNHQSDFGGSHHVDSPSSEGNSSLQVIGFPSPQPNLPLWKTMEDFPAPPMPECMSNQDSTRGAATMLPDGVAGKQESSSVFDIVHSGPFLGVGQNSTDLVNSSAVSDGDFVDISDSLLNLSNEDEMAFMDIDEKEAVDKTLTDSVNLAPQGSSRAVDAEVKVKCEPDILMIKESSSNATNDELPIKSETNPASPQNGQKTDCCLDGNAPSTSGSDGIVPSLSEISAEFRELDSGITYCTLNTEDTEIPCNDDIFLLIHPSSAFSSSTSPPFSGDALDPAFSVGKASEHVINLSNKVNDGSQSFQWQQNIRPSCSLDSHLANPCLGAAGKSELPDANYPGAHPTNSSKAKAYSSNDRLSSVITNVPSDRMPGDDFSRAHLRGQDPHASLEAIPHFAEAGSLKSAVPEPAMNTSVSDPEEFESDDDVPYFSDVEAMILEMDLDPPEDDSSFSRQALRYQFEETKRSIMRLEQCARSCLQRMLTSQGAFAILSGHHLKHYIRKTEVVLGRSTDDVNVDVDLRREGRASKISRRQAIIRMEADGSFSLKNIGKSSISVNGKSIITGQSLILSSGCLIEISRMSFSFEINQRFVRRHMDATARIITVKNKFDWSPDYIP